MNAQIVGQQFSHFGLFAGIVDRVKIKRLAGSLSLCREFVERY
jgi:hypothetical protein